MKKIAYKNTKKTAQHKSDTPATDFKRVALVHQVRKIQLKDTRNLR